jgi:pyruvate dehydrogenase E2 component (dihydrolipoamide acetyltransferase)
VHVLREATGTPLVAIHGFAADANAWRPLMRALPGRKIVAIELPAHGSSPQGVPRDFAALAHSVIAAFDALGASRVHLIGHSLGAAVCLALAEARPETLASLTLIAPAGLGPEIWGAGIAGVARASGAASLGPWLKAMVGNEAMFTPELVAAAASLRTDPAMREAQATLAERLFPDGTQAFDMRNALAGLTMPARLLWGRADKVIPWSHALGAPPQAGLHLLPGIGHMPHMEAPAEVARIVTELIRATGEGS